MWLFSALCIIYPILTLTLGEQDNGNSLEPVVNKTSHAKILGDKRKLSLAFYKRAHSYLIKAQIHKNFTLQDTIEHVDGAVNWKPPRDLEKRFPYYLAGYDWEDQPVWISEVGKFDVRGEIERGPESVKNLTKYMYQAFFNILESIDAKDNPSKDISAAVFIGDLEGVDVTQAAHLPTVQFALHQFLLYGAILGPWVDRVIAINVTYLATVIFDSIRPLLGGILERMELYGTNKATWKQVLHKLLPPETIPSWYGGKKDFKPVRVFG